MAKVKRKSRATWLLIDLPSNGINYEQFGDREIEQHIDHLTGAEARYSPGDMQFEQNHHKWLRLERETHQTILWDCTKWGDIRDKMCEYHTESFDFCVSKDLGFELELKHLSGDTAKIKLSVAKRLLRMMKRDDWEAFKEVFKEEDNQWPQRESDELTQHPLTSWNSKEIGWLLRAALAVGKEVPLDLSRFELLARQAAKMPTTQFIPQRTESEFDSDVYMGMCNGDGEYTAWSEAVDWKKYEAKIQEARQHLFDELSEEDRQWLINHGHWDGVLSLAARCPLTLELPLADLIGDGADNLSLSQMV